MLYQLSYAGSLSYSTRLALSLASESGRIQILAAVAEKKSVEQWEKQSQATSVPVRVRLVSSGRDRSAPFPPQELSDSLVVDYSPEGMALVVSQVLSPGQLLAIESDQTLLLGEVRYCQPQAGGAGFRVDVHTEHRMGFDPTLWLTDSEADTIPADLQFRGERLF